LHAEGVGWPLKKTGKTINAKQKAEVIEGDFSFAMENVA
jgi:hypothetical protein